jgi:uncharacterized membrane protein
MNVAIALVRLIHIFSGVFWAGGAIVLAAYVEPSAAATAPESNKFMQRFVGSGFVTAMGLAGPLTVLAGLTLYLVDSGGLSNGWITTPTGLGFTIGGLAGLVAFVIGFFISRTTAESMGALGKEMQAAGKPPTPEQMGKMKALQEKLSQASVATAIVLAVAVAAMAMSRYL